MVNSPTKQMLNRMLAILLILVVVTVTAAGISLVNIMVLNGEKYQKMATEQQL